MSEACTALDHNLQQIETQFSALTCRVAVIYKSITMRLGILSLRIFISQMQHLEKEKYFSVPEFIRF